MAGTLVHEGRRAFGSTSQFASPGLSPRLRLGSAIRQSRVLVVRVSCGFSGRGERVSRRNSSDGWSMLAAILRRIANCELPIANLPFAAQEVEGLARVAVR